MQKKKEVWRAVKFVLFSASAGIIQIGLFTLLNELAKWSYWPLSDCAGCVGRVELHAEPEVHVQKRQQCAEGDGAGALLLRGIHAAVHDFRKLAGKSCHWNEYLVTVLNMLLNFVTEYLFDTFVVFRGSMDTNDIAKKEEAK